MDIIKVSIIILLAFNLKISASSSKIIQKSAHQVDFKNPDMQNHEKIFLFKNYLSTMMTSDSSLINSIWSKMSYYQGKSIEKFRNEQLDFSTTNAHPNLIKFVKINDRNLRCHFQNNNITILHAMKHFKDILKETHAEKTSILCVINAKEKIKLDQEDQILETNDCLYIPPKLMTTMIEKHSNEKDKIEVSDGSVNRFRFLEPNREMC